MLIFVICSAHVDFDSKEGVDNAIKKNGQELDGRALRIDMSVPRQGGNGGRGGFGGRGRGGFSGRGVPMDPMKRAQKSGAIIAPTENKVTVLDDSDDE